MDIKMDEQIKKISEEKNMKYCKHCGKELMEQAVVCTNCGCVVDGLGMGTEADVPSGGLNALAFFIPLVGLILYLVNNEKTPRKAKAIGKWALIGFVVGLVSVGLLYGIGLAAILW